MKRLAILLIMFLGNVWAGPVAVAGPEPLPVPDNAGIATSLEADLTANASTTFSIPLDVGRQDIGRWLEKTGLSPVGIHAWNARAQQYAKLNTLRPGEGFLLAKGPGKVPINGQRVVADSVKFPLEKGWNLIGMPFETAIPMAALRIDLAGVTKAYQPAAEKKWVGGVNSLVNGQMLPVAVDGPARLEPWRGYWLYAYQPCMLEIPSAQSLEKSAARKKKPAKR